MMLRHTSGAVSVVEVSYGARGLPDAFPATLLEIEGDRGAIRDGRGLPDPSHIQGKLTSMNGDAPCCPGRSVPGMSCRRAS